MNITRKHVAVRKLNVLMDKDISIDKIFMQQVFIHTCPYVSHSSTLSAKVCIWNICLQKYVAALAFIY